MDIFGILDPDPHENLCGSETLILLLIIESLYEFSRMWLRWTQRLRTCWRPWTSAPSLSSSPPEGGRGKPRHLLVPVPCMMYHRYLFEAIVPVRTLSIVLAGVEAEIMAGRQNVSGTISKWSGTYLNFWADANLFTGIPRSPSWPKTIVFMNIWPT